VCRVPLDRHDWQARTELASASFEWIEAFYNPRRRHSALGNLSPAAYEALHNNSALTA
jgi:transposase InsO family protein